MVKVSDVAKLDELEELFTLYSPDYVINCIGVVKQLSESYSPLISIPINSLFPHQLDKLCSNYSSKLIQISTDCVFSGKKGLYQETDTPDAEDLYGRSKLLGEVISSNSITLRTSIIGHELNSNRSLINWFLSQSSSVNGFKKAIFSGFPTIEIAKILDEYVIPNKNLTGLYHVSSDPIDKYTLLKLVAEIYGKEINILEENETCVDRSLDSTKFRRDTGFEPPSWKNLIKSMHDFK